MSFAKQPVVCTKMNVQETSNRRKDISEAGLPWPVSDRGSAGPKFCGLGFKIMPTIPAISLYAAH